MNDWCGVVWCGVEDDVYAVFCVVVVVDLCGYPCLFRLPIGIFTGLGTTLHT